MTRFHWYFFQHFVIVNDWDGICMLGALVSKTLIFKNYIIGNKKWHHAQPKNIKEDIFRSVIAVHLSGSLHSDNHNVLSYAPPAPCPLQMSIKNIDVLQPFSFWKLSFPGKKGLEGGYQLWDFILIWFRYASFDLIFKS